MWKWMVTIINSWMTAVMALPFFPNEYCCGMIFKLICKLFAMGETTGRCNFTTSYSKFIDDLCREKIDHKFDTKMTNVDVSWFENECMWITWCDQEVNSKLYASAPARVNKRQEPASSSFLTKPSSNFFWWKVFLSCIKKKNFFLKPL